MILHDDSLTMIIDAAAAEDSINGSVTMVESSTKIYIPCSIQHPRMVFVWANDVESMASPSSSADNAGDVGLFFSIIGAYRTVSGSVRTPLSMYAYANSSLDSYTIQASSSFSLEDGVITLDTGNSGRKFVQGKKYEYKILA